MPDEIMVRQWSFLPYYEGQKPDSQGRYTTLIPLASLPPGLKEEYSEAQAGFIQEQIKRREQSNAKNSATKRKG